MGKRIFLFVAVNALVLLTILLVTKLLGVDQLLGGGYGPVLIFCLLFGMGGAFISLLFSKTAAKWMMGVRVIPSDTSDQSLRELLETVHQFARRANLPGLPEVGVYDSPEINAFATGPSKSNSLVAVSTGLLRRMDRSAIEGVLAHEVAHIANGDMVTMTLIQGVVNAFVLFLARIFAFGVSAALRGRDESGQVMGGGFFMHYVFVYLFEIVFTVFGAVLTCWFSRQREFRADAGGLLIAGKERMIGALRALQQAYGGPVNQKESMAFQSLKISGRTGGLMALLTTHPPLDERIARLQRLGH